MEPAKTRQESGTVGIPVQEEGLVILGETGNGISERRMAGILRLAAARSE